MVHESFAKLKRPITSSETGRNVSLHWRVFGFDKEVVEKA